MLGLQPSGSTGSWGRDRVSKKDELSGCGCGTGWKLLAGWSSWGPGRVKPRYGSVNNTLGALILWRGQALGALGYEGTWERTRLAVGLGRTRPRVWQALWGVLGLAAWALSSPEGFGSGRHSLWAGSALKYRGFLSARLEALKARTCTAAAGSGQAFSEPLPALVPSEASLPVLR